jgi:hypothetical protein
MTKPIDSLASLDQELKNKRNERETNLNRMKAALKDSGKGSANTSFPLDVFPAKLKEMVEAYCWTFGSDPGHYGLAILTVAGAIIGNAAWVEERGTGHPPLIYGVIVDQPGRGKTPIIRTVLRPLIDIEREMREQHAQALREWKKQTQEAGKDGEHPTPPSGKELVLYDFTLESVYRVLQASPRGVIVTRDEVAGWVNSMNQYKQKGSEEQFWLENYNSGMVKINRQKTERPLMVYNSFVAVIGGTQPKILEKFVEGDKAHNGFLARMLWSYPDTTTKQNYNNRKVDGSYREFWSKIIKTLYALPCRQTAPTDEFDEWRLDPVMIPLSSKAETLYQNYYDSIAEAVNASDDEVEQSVLTKYDSHVLRLAGILHFLQWSEKTHDSWIDGLGITIDEMANMRISEEAMQGAIRLAKYFRYTSLKVVGRVSSPIDTLPELQKLWYNNLPEEFERAIAVEMGEVAKISPRTVSRLLQNPVLFKRQRQGVYWKNHLS